LQNDIVVEWIYGWDRGAPVHHRVQVPLKESLKGNLYFNLGEDPYVLTERRTGAPVLGLIGGRWRPVGRVMRGGHKVFIGSTGEPSLDETLKTGKPPKEHPLEPLSVPIAAQ